MVERAAPRGRRAGLGGELGRLRGEPLRPYLRKARPPRRLHLGPPGPPPRSPHPTPSAVLPLSRQTAMRTMAATAHVTKPQ